MLERDQNVRMNVKILDFYNIYITRTLTQCILPDAIKYFFIILKIRKVLNLYSHGVTFSKNLSTVLATQHCSYCTP